MSEPLIELTQQPIDTAALLARVQQHAAGAVVLFLGTTRAVTDGRGTDSLEYECFPEMAQQELTRLAQRARADWPLCDCGIVHRLGHLAPGEASVAVAVSAPHRREAFEAAQWIMDRLKESVPIWKKENWSDGTSDWVHPGS